MVATSRAGRPVAGGATPKGRGQPSASGTDRVPGDDAAVGADGTGTVVHGDVRTSERARTAGTARVATPPECSPAPREAVNGSGRWSGPPDWYRWRPREPPCPRWDDRDVRARSGTSEHPARLERAVDGRPETTGRVGGMAGGRRRKRRRLDPAAGTARIEPDRRASSDPATVPGRRRSARRGGARRAPRHRPRHRRAPGRVARPARAVPDDRRRDEAGAAGRRDDHPDPARRAASRSPPGPGWPTTSRGRLPRPRRDEGRVGEVLRSGHVLAVADVRVDRDARRRALRRRLRHRRPPRRPADPPRPGHRRAVGGDPRAARLDERRRRLHLDPRDARRDRRSPTPSCSSRPSSGRPSSRSSRPPRPG